MGGRGPDRGGGLASLLLFAAVVQASVAASTSKSVRSTVPGDDCSPYVTNDVYVHTDVVDITLGRLTDNLTTVVDMWLNIQVRYTSLAFSDLTRFPTRMRCGNVFGRICLFVNNISYGNFRNSRPGKLIFVATIHL